MSVVSVTSFVGSAVANVEQCAPNAPSPLWAPAGSGNTPSTSHRIVELLFTAINPKHRLVIMIYNHILQWFFFQDFVPQKCFSDVQQ